MCTKVLQTLVIGVNCALVGCGGAEDSALHSSGGTTGVTVISGSGPVQNGGSGGKTYRDKTGG